MQDIAPIERDEKFEQLQDELKNNVAKIFTSELNEYIENVRKIMSKKLI